MSVYLIHAYERIYRGKNGMDTWEIAEYNHPKEAINDAIEMSYDVIQGYSSITDELTARAYDYVSYDLEEKEFLSSQQIANLFDEYYDTCVKEDVYYVVIKLNDRYNLNDYINLIKTNSYDYSTLAEVFGEEEY